MKKVCSVLLATSALMGSFAFAASGAALGDIDGNGKIESADARVALRASVGLETLTPGSEAFLAADHDKNGKIEAADARRILRISVGLPADSENKLPAYSKKQNVNDFINCLSSFGFTDYYGVSTCKKYPDSLDMLVMPMLKSDDSIQTTYSFIQYTGERISVKASDFRRYCKLLFGDEAGTILFGALSTDPHKKLYLDTSTDTVLEGAWGDAPAYTIDFDHPVAEKDAEFEYEVCLTRRGNYSNEVYDLTYKFKKVVDNGTLFYQLVSITSGNTVGK